jgi:hypothetical protein
VSLFQQENVYFLVFKSLIALKSAERHDPSAVSANKTLLLAINRDILVREEEFARAQTRRLGDAEDFVLRINCRTKQADLTNLHHFFYTSFNFFDLIHRKTAIDGK